MFELRVASAQLFQLAALCGLKARLWATLLVRERLQRSLATQLASRTQVRGVKALSAQQRADLTATVTLISLL